MSDISLISAKSIILENVVGADLTSLMHFFVHLSTDRKSQLACQIDNLWKAIIGYLMVSPPCAKVSLNNFHVSWRLSSIPKWKIISKVKYLAMDLD